MRPSEFMKWRPPTTKVNAEWLEQEVLTCDALEGHTISLDIFVLSTCLTAEGHRSQATDLMTVYNTECGESPYYPPDVAECIRMLNEHQLFDPTVPITAPADAASSLNNEYFDITKPTFYESWSNSTINIRNKDHTGAEYIALKASHFKFDEVIPLGEEYDMHQWKTSDDPWTVAICAHLLCQTPKGQVPERAAVNEAFEAADKLFMHLPGTANEWDSLQNKQRFPIKVYYLLALGLGKPDKAQDIMRLACSAQDWSISELLDVPDAFEMMRSMDPPPLEVWTDDEANALVSSLTRAIKERQNGGQREPLSDVPWPELLQRFSVAAWATQQDELEHLDPEEMPTCAADMLLPPISEEKLAEVEAKLGPLPTDIKEMALIHNGFKGGWHFAAGGFPGVDSLWADPAGNHETWLGIDPVVHREARTITQPDGTIKTVMVNTINFPGSGTGTDWGPVYETGAQSAVECDCYSQIICPPETWKKIKGDAYKEGEYLVTTYSNWGGTDGNWRSMRHWVADLTFSLEKTVALLACQ